MWKNKLLLLVLIGIVLFYNSAFAQLSPYQGIINPYERYGGLGGSFGGVILAEPDAVPSPLDNPAGTAFQRAPQLFVGMNTQFIKYKNNYYRVNLSETTNWESEFNPGQIAGIYPLHLIHHESVLTFSLANIPAPEFEGGFVTKIDTFPDMNHNRTGNVGTATIGFGIKVTETFSIGLSYTRWLGAWTWEDKEQNDDNSLIHFKYGKGKFEYNGNCFNLGMIKQIERFSIGILLQSPFTLMTAKDARVCLAPVNIITDVEQKYNGAAALATSYRLNANTKLGIGYRFQNDLEYSFDNPPYTMEQRKKVTHKLSLAGEYTLHCSDIAFPVYLAYQKLWHEGFDEFITGYLRANMINDYRIHNSLQMGINCVHQSFGVQLAAGWQQYTLRLYNALDSISDSSINPTAWNDVKKINIMFNFGLSYYFK